MGDFELLRAYVEHGTEAAFTELVNRHLNLVYSAAQRQVADAHTAAEISQSVFIILARKARTIRQGTVLAGWLLRTTRYTAANARRREQHRHVTEQQAVDHLYLTETDAAWKQIAPLLDEALVALRERDRDAVALRFFEERSFKEIGAALSISEDSARKRVSRALKRLRSLLARKGCVVPVAGVTLAISGRVAKAAPAELAETVTAAVLKGTATVASFPLLVQGTLRTLSWIRWRRMAIRTATVGLTVSLAVFFSQLVSIKGAAQPNRTPVQLSALQPATAKTVAFENSAPITQLPPQPIGERLLFRVVDAESQSPLEKVRLTLTWVTEFPARRTNTYATDSNGECMLPIDRTPVKNWNSRVEVFKDGYVPKFVSWSAPQGDTIDAIPTQYTARLTRGIEIGGVVVNEEGEPVPDVRVVFTVSGPSPGASHDRERLTMMGNYHAEATDVQGRWRCDHVPQQFGMITYECLHPLYLPTRFGSTTLGASTALGFDYVAEADLRNGTARTMLKTGPLVTGSVVDEAGKPIPHAKVTENRAWHEPSASEETGSGGRFRFANNSQKDLVLTVQAKDFAPIDLTIHPGEQTGALTVTLSKGGLLRGKIVDWFGQPVADARISVENAKSGNRRFEWSARSDAQGTFEWASAPPNQVTYEVEASGYQSQSSVELMSDGSEHVITLQQSAQQGKAFRISGTAVDSETGKPIENFRVLTMTTEGERTPSGMKATSTSSPELQVIGTAGKFSFDGHRSILHYIVELQAVGYCPARMELDGPLAKDAQLAFELKQAAQVTGVVRLPDGRPATDAVVMLSAEEPRQDSRFPSRMQAVYMKLPGEFDLVRSQASRTSTDSEGRFSFEPKLAMKRILVAHKSGYADVSLEQLAVSSILTLQPWGRVVGTLRIGNRPGTNETLYLRDWGWAYLFSPSLEINLEAHTDSEGHFSIEGVPPGEWKISHEVRLRSEGLGTDELKPVKIEIGRGTSMILPPRSGPGVSRLIRVEPGQTAMANLGGTGRRLVGKVNPSSITQRIDWQRDVHRLTSKATRPQVGPTPKRDDFTSDQEYGLAQQQWYARAREFWLSDVGSQAKLLASDYVLVFETDGSFQIDDVLPGDYELRIRVSDPTIPDSFFRGNSLGTLAKEISVPEMSDASVSEPLDLGVLELTPGNR